MSSLTTSSSVTSTTTSLPSQPTTNEDSSSVTAAHAHLTATGSGLPISISHLSHLASLTVDGAAVSESGGLSSNTLLANLMANPSLESPDTISYDNETSSDDESSISSVLTRLSISQDDPSAAASTSSAYSNATVSNDNPETSNQDPQAITSAATTTPPTTTTATTTTATTTTATTTTSSTDTNSTGSSSKPFISMTEILAEVQELASNTANQVSAQTNSLISSNNSMLSAAVTAAGYAVQAARDDLNAAYISFFVTIGVSVVGLGVGAYAGAYAMKGPKVSEEGVSGGTPDKPEVVVGKPEEKPTSSTTESKPTTYQRFRETFKSPSTVEAQPVKEVDPTSTTETTTNGASKTGMLANKEPDGLATSPNDKNLPEATEAERNAHQMKAQWIGSLGTIVSGWSQAASALAAAPDKLASAKSTADSQKWQALSSYFNTAIGVCNSNISAISKTVGDLESTASSVAQAMAGMVSSTRV